MKLSFREVDAMTEETKAICVISSGISTAFGLMK
jgi:hypothetical protein